MSTPGLEIGNMKEMEIWNMKENNYLFSYFVERKEIWNKKEMFLIIIFIKWEYQPKECFGPSAHSEENLLETLSLMKFNWKAILALGKQIII